MGLSVYYQKFNDATFDDSGWPGFWAAAQDGSVKLSFPIMRHFPHFVEGIYTLFAQDVQDLWSAVPQNELIADDSAFASTTNDTMWEVLIGVLDEPGYEPLKMAMPMRTARAIILQWASSPSCPKCSARKMIHFVLKRLTVTVSPAS